MEKKIYENYMIGDFEYLLQQEWLEKLNKTFGNRECVDKYAAECYCWKDSQNNNYMTALANDLYLNNNFAKRSKNEEIMAVTVGEVTETFDWLCEKQMVAIKYEVDHPTLLDDKFILQASLEGRIGDALPDEPNTTSASIVYNSLSKVINEFKDMIEVCKDYAQLKEVADTLNKLGVVAPEFVKRIAVNAQAAENGLSKLRSKQQECEGEKDDKSNKEEKTKNNGNHHNEGR